MDLIHNTGVREAIAGKELIFHLATDRKRNQDHPKSFKSFGWSIKGSLIIYFA